MRHDRNFVPERQLWSCVALKAVPIETVTTAARALTATTSAGTWVAAAAFTTLMHIGLYMALTTTDASAPEPQPPMQVAMMIDMAPVAAAPQSTVDNADRGPQSDASEARDDAQKPPPPEVAEAIPVLPETPPDAKTDVLLPEVQKTVEKKPEEPVKEPPPEKEIKKEQPKPQVKQVATKNSGAPKSAALAQHASGGDPSWKAEVRSRIVRAKVYPSDAKSQGKTGSALVAVVISGSGQLISASLVASSRVPSLDAEAVAVMRRAAPYPPTPDGRTTSMRIPIAFSIR